jgi:serine O-acetyltransferase
LGDDVIVLAKASVLGPVTVGDRAVVAAHALVIDDVPSGSIARGLPARTSPRLDAFATSSSDEPH